MSKFTDIGVEKNGHVTTIEIQRPPLNFFDVSLINQIADALSEIDNDIEARAVVLAAQGKAFCAGANFNDPARQEGPPAPKRGPSPPPPFPPPRGGRGGAPPTTPPPPPPPQKPFFPPGGS